MYLISRDKVNSIVEKYEAKVTNDTTPKQMLEIIKDIVFEAINSVDTGAIIRIVKDHARDEDRVKFY